MKQNLHYSSSDKQSLADMLEVVPLNCMSSPAAAVETAILLRDSFPKPLPPKGVEFRKYTLDILSDSDPVSVAYILDKTAARNDFIHTIDRIYTLLSWYDLGMPTFVPTHSLVASLMLTDYRTPKLRGSDIPLPFPSFGIVIPNGWAPAPFDKWAMIWCHTYIASYADGTESTGIRVDLSMRDTSLGYHALLDLKDPIVKLLKDRGLATDALPLEGEEWSFVEAGIRLSIGLPLYLASVDFDRHKNESEAYRRVDRGSRSTKSKKNRRDARSPSPDPPTHGQGALHLVLWEIGKDIKLGPELRKAAADFTGRHLKVPSQDGVWRVSHRFAVRGHFKRYLVGAKSDNRREIKWVKPHFRGPEKGVLLARKYEVE